MSFKVPNLSHFDMGRLRRNQMLLALILFLSIVLFCFRIDYRGLWIDEFISLIDATDLTLNRGRFLYYVLLKGWMWFGHSDAWLRLLSVLFAIGSVYFLYRLGRYLFGETVGLMAALMLAVSPLFINHAQEVRYYCMGVFLGIVGSFCLAVFLQNPHHRFSLVGWTSFRLLAVFTTPLYLAFIFSDITIAILTLRDRKRAIFHFFLGVFAFLLLIIPSILSIINSAGMHRLTLPIPGIQELFRQLRIFTVFAHPPPPPYNRFLQVYILLFAGLLLYAIVQNIKIPNARNKFLWVLAWGAFPIGIIFVFSHIFYSIWTTRYLMLALPYVVLLAAIGIEQLWKQIRWLAIALIGIYTIALLSGLFTYYTTQQRYMGASGSYREVAQIIEKHDRPQDKIVWSIIHGTDYPLRHYYDGPAKIYEKDMPSHQDRSRQVLEKWIMGLSDIQSRFWLVYHGTSPELYEVLDAKFQIERYETIEDDFSIFLLSP